MRDIAVNHTEHRVEYANAQCGKYGNKRIQVYHTRIIIPKYLSFTWNNVRMELYVPTEYNYVLVLLINW